MVITPISIPSLTSYLIFMLLMDEKHLVQEPLRYVEADARRGDKRLIFLVRHGSEQEIVADLQTFNLNIGFLTPGKPHLVSSIFPFRPSSAILQAID